MKIALITSLYPRPTGTFIQRDINGLRIAGADVHVYPIYPREKKIFKDSRVFSTLEGKKPYWEKVHHINGMSFQYFSGLIKLLFSRYEHKYLIDAYRQYRKQGVKSLFKYIYSIPKAFAWSPLPNKYDHVVSFWGNYAGTIGYFMAKRSNIPFSTFLHAGTDLYRDRAFLLEKLLFSEKIICNCQFNVNFLKKTYPNYFNEINKKIIMHRIGLDLSRYEVTDIDIDSKDFRICVIGGLEKYKGSLRVLNSFNNFVKAGFNGCLTFCGTGPLMKELKKTANKFGIENKVGFKGICSVDEVNEVLSESHLLVHASPSIGDAVPTVLEEAAAMARPVIATNVAGIPELVEDGRSGVLVEPGNIEA
ncbi:MAG: glycosyltransferase family 4 protein, partial [Bacteroidetes bacterium]|nr:glycosyltransferase family 4 protein [Bacteroidota bacterium]